MILYKEIKGIIAVLVLLISIFLCFEVLFEVLPARLKRLQEWTENRMFLILKGAMDIIAVTIYTYHMDIFQKIITKGTFTDNWFSFPEYTRNFSRYFILFEIVFLVFVLLFKYHIKSKTKAQIAYIVHTVMLASMWLVHILAFALSDAMDQVLSKIFGTSPYNTGDYIKTAVAGFFLLWLLLQVIIQKKQKKEILSTNELIGK